MWRTYERQERVILQNFHTSDSSQIVNGSKKKFYDIRILPQNQSCHKFSATDDQH